MFWLFFNSTYFLKHTWLVQTCHFIKSYFCDSFSICNQTFCFHVGDFIPHVIFQLVSPHYFKQFAIGSYFELRFSRKLPQTSDAFQDLKPVELFYFCICKLVLIHAGVCVLVKINKMMYTVKYFFFYLDIFC